MIGIGNLTTSIAPAIGPTYGGLLTSLLNWNYIFLFLIPVLLVSLVLGLYSIPKIEIEKLVVWICGVFWVSLLCLVAFCFS